MRTIQTTLYKLVFQIIKSLTFGEVKIWYRNSLYFNQLSSFKSDIDITVFGESDKDIIRTISTINFLKKIIPIIGEINSYNQAEISNYQDYSNYFEIRRDPELVNYLKLNSTPRESEKKVFISRMLLANEKQIQKGIFNSTKWQFYFSHIQEPSPKIIEEVFRFLEISSIDHLLTDISLNPIPIMSQALHQRNFDDFLNKVSGLTPEQKKLLIDNLRWEVFGVYSQKYSIKDKNSIVDHFENIRKVLQRLESPLANRVTTPSFDILDSKQIY